MLGCRFDLTEKERLGRSGYAVGLSAISFSATLQKDAAPIPNASVAAKIKSVQTLECVHNTKYFQIFRFYANK